MPKICVFVSVNVQVRILHEKHQNRRKSLKRARDLEKRQRSYQGIISLEEKPKNDLYSTKVQSMTKKTYDQSLKLCQAKSFKIELIDNKSPFEAFGIGVDIYPPSYKLVFYVLSIFSSLYNSSRVWCT